MILETFISQKFYSFIEKNLNYFIKRIKLQKFSKLKFTNQKTLNVEIKAESKKKYQHLTNKTRRKIGELTFLEASNGR